MYPGESALRIYCTRYRLKDFMPPPVHIVHKTCGTLTGLLYNVTGDFKFKICPIACWLAASYGLQWVVIVPFVLNSSAKEKAN